MICIYCQKQRPLFLFKEKVFIPIYNADIICKVCEDCEWNIPKFKDNNEKIDYFIKMNGIKNIPTHSGKNVYSTTTKLKQYNIDNDYFNKLFETQKGKCAICGIHQLKLKRALSIDHCHKTGKVRGLLCSKCNTGIGMLQDNTEFLKNAIDYLDG